MEEPSMNSKTGTFPYSEIVEITSDFETVIGRGGLEEVRKSMEEPSMNSKTGTFPCSEIVEITSDFETVIGKGGFEEVRKSMEEPSMNSKNGTFPSSEIAEAMIRKRVFGEVRKSMEEPAMNSETRTFTSSEVFEITSNFKTMIGRGGFGAVYLGTLKDGTDVAVKILLSSSEQCRKAFITEAKLLTDVHQLNLVSLRGYCDEDGKEALILEYMSNGNLKQHLSGNRGVLTWFQRLQIAFDVTCGLDYLHDHKPPIIHRDLKPDNILLNENLQAKIADFGLSKAFATESTSHLSTCPGGTPGYIDFDSYNTGQTRKGNDVYSLGIILLELVSGKPAIITLDNGERINIFNWEPIKRRNIREIVDPTLNGEFNINVARKVIEIALSCVKPIRKRPDISHVLTKLRECLHIEMKSRALDKTAGRLKLPVGLSKNIRQKGAIMKSMEKQVTTELTAAAKQLMSGIYLPKDVEAIMKSRNVGIFTQIEAAIRGGAGILNEGRPNFETNSG